MQSQRLIGEYIGYLQQLGRAGGTIDLYAYYVRTYEKWLSLYHGAGLLDASEDNLQEWRASLTTSPATILNTVAAIRGFYRFAVRRRWISVDPTTDLPLPRKPRRLPRPISEDDLQIALDAADSDVRISLVLAAWAGFRCCEITSLEREQIFDTAAAPMFLVHGKGDKDRLVPISPYVWSELLLFGLPRRGHLLRRRDARPGPPTPKRLSALVNEHLRACGIGDTFHALRHRFGTQTKQATDDLQIIAELMGHASLDTTRLYTKFDMRKGIEVVNAIQPTTPRLRVVRPDH